MTLYLTEIFICVIYLLSLVWARYQDKKDVLKVFKLQVLKSIELIYKKANNNLQSGLTPLLDNDVRDKYLYEVIINTGMGRNAGTHSKVKLLFNNL